MPRKGQEQLEPPEEGPGHRSGPGAIQLSFMPGKFSKKSSWRKVEAGHVADVVAGLPLPELADGRVGIWLTAGPKHRSAGKMPFWRSLLRFFGGGDRGE